MGDLTLTVGGPPPNPRICRWDGTRFQPVWVGEITSTPRIFRGWANPAKEGFTLVAGDRWERDALSSPPNVILDTDLASDVDDCQDVKAALVLHAEGKINLLGIVVSCTNPYGPAVVAAFQRHYFGSVLVPIASIYQDDNDYFGTTAALYQHLYDNFDHTGYGLQDSGGPILRASHAIRQWLNASSGNVRIVATGLLGAIMAAYSSADGAGGVSGAGAALFAAKVQRVYWTAGLFPSGWHRRQASSGAQGGVTGDNSWPVSTEFNFVTDPASQQALIATPVQITMIGIEIVSGLTEPPNASGTGPARARIAVLGNDSYTNARLPSGDILRTAYERWAVATAQNGREPWGMSGLMYACEWQDRNSWGFSEVAGTISREVTGESLFAAGAGNHRYVRIDPARVTDVQRELQSLQAADCVTGDYTWNGSAWV